MLKKSLYLACTASLLTASTTMCYKKGHLDPSTIQSVTLEGGICAGKYGVVDMKEMGYSIENLKLQNETSGTTYIYVFKKEKTDQNKSVTSSITNQQLTKQLEAIEEEKSTKKEQEQKVTALEKGKKVYNSTCKRCHGDDGSTSAYNSARPLNELSLEEMQISIRDYTNGSKDNGMAMLMTPYANIVTSEELKGIYEYLKTLN